MKVEEVSHSEHSEILVAHSLQLLVHFKHYFVGDSYWKYPKNSKEDILN